MKICGLKSLKILSAWENTIKGLKKIYLGENLFKMSAY